MHLECLGPMVASAFTLHFCCTTLMVGMADRSCTPHSVLVPHSCFTVWVVLNEDIFVLVSVVYRLYTHHYLLGMCVFLWSALNFI